MTGTPPNGRSNKNNTMKNKNIILFSSDDWGWKTSKYQLSTRFAKSNRVLFVSSIGFRSPGASAADLKRIFSKLKQFLSGVKEVKKNLYVLTPLVIPFSWFPARKSINKLIFKFQLGWAKRRLKMSAPYLFVFSQNWYDYIRDMKREKLIYYTVDEQAGFNGLNGSNFAEFDRSMNTIADVIFCSARTLYNKNRKSNSNTHYMPHGVSYELFASALDTSTAIADDMKSIPRPILLFFGHISYDWVDQELIKYLAEQRPDWSLVLVGRYSMRAGEFSNFNNIYLLGEKAFEDLPGYCKGADLGIIPFVYSTLTNNCNPLKLPEYVAAGLPVVSTDIPEVRRAYADKTYIGENSNSFLLACERALADNDDDRNRMRAKAMAEHSWDQRVNSIYRIVQAG